jgi:hypothetical protein
MMTLDTFEQALSKTLLPARNDREECENALKALLLSAQIDETNAALYARHMALGLDLFQGTGLRPLYFWIDDRSQARLPSGALPYDITLASALHRAEGNGYVLAVWEMAERQNRVSLLLPHKSMESPFSGETSLLEVLAAMPPSHRLYQDLRWVPYRYKPETDTFLDADSGPPDIPAQHRFLGRRYTVGMAI